MVRKKGDLIQISLLAVEELVRQYEEDGDIAGVETALVAKRILDPLRQREQEAYERRFSPPTNQLRTTASLPGGAVPAADARHERTTPD